MSTFPKVFRLIVALVSVSVFVTTGKGAESAKIEIHTLPTVSLSDEQFLTGSTKDGKPDVIAAELRLPQPGMDRMPAMLIVHGSGGIMGNEDRWAQELNNLGIATLLVVRHEEF